MPTIDKRQPRKSCFVLSIHSQSTNLQLNRPLSFIYLRSPFRRRQDLPFNRKVAKQKRSLNEWSPYRCPVVSPHYYYYWYSIIPAHRLTIYRQIGRRKPSERSIARKEGVPGNWIAISRKVKQIQCESHLLCSGWIALFFFFFLCLCAAMSIPIPVMLGFTSCGGGVS